VPSARAIASRRAEQASRTGRSECGYSCSNDILMNSLPHSVKANARACQKRSLVREPADFLNTLLLRGPRLPAAAPAKWVCLLELFWHISIDS